MHTLEQALRQSLRHWQQETSEQEGMSLTAEYCFAPDFPGFAGHFPGRPVLPAVVQLAAVRQLAELAMADKLITVGCRGAKFRGMVLPEEPMSVAVQLSPLEQGWQAKFTLVKAEGPVASGHLTLAQRRSR